jgi:hypothetical protein
MGPDGNLQKVAEDISPSEILETLTSAPVSNTAPGAAPVIPNPDNIPGITAENLASHEPIVEPESESESESPATPERFPILDNYGHMSHEDLYALHYNREKGRASAMSDEDLLKVQAELELIQTIGKIRQRIYEDTRQERIEDTKKSSKEKQRLKDASFKVKNRETIKKETEAKEAKEKKPRESQAEQMARFMGISVDEAHQILNSKKG